MARKILLADDSVTAQNMGRKILSDAGYEVTAVNNGSAALKKIAEIRPDLIVLDVYMPGYSGLEVCQRLKEAPETARTPVLLTVGKLEPFKPEEAQRVRAEAFIVKPFEASELLSALSKLEDKVVPRPETSKPGRFARTIAAVEASDRDRGETSDSNGWKKRINFPRSAPAVDEKPSDDSALYNPVNRDLRTVVETSAGEPASHSEVKSAPQPVSEASVDVTALAPEGLPRDVTPEEVAAITAAAAQIQAAEANNGGAQKTDVLASDMQSAATAPLPPKDEPRIHEVPPVEVQNQTSSTEAAHSGDVSSSHDEPVTMAAAPESLPPTGSAGSRWTAISVALDSDEAELSLADEMQKAYAALAAGDAFSALAQAAPEVYGVPAEHPHAQDAADAFGPVMPEASIAAEIKVQKGEPDKVVSASPHPIAAPAVSEVAGASNTSVGFVAQSSPAPAADLNCQESAISASETLPSQPEAHASEPPAPDGHFVSSVSTDAALAAETKAEPQTPAEEKEESKEKDDPRFARAAVASGEGSSFTVLAPTQEEAATDSAAHTGIESYRDEETGSAMAAWSSWNQIREVNREPGVAAAQPERVESIPSSETRSSEDSTSHAGAAGAEQITQESPAASSTEVGETKDVASIVESVLADLRPRLMEEISRKMGQKK